MKIDRELFYEAVKEGVKDAILTMCEAGDGYSGPIIREQFLEALREGMRFSNNIREENLKMRNSKGE